MSGDNIVEVEESLAGRYTQTIRSGQHTLIADEPVTAGGSNAGPGPYEFLLAALGACTCMTVRMYADRKNIPLSRIRTRLAHRKIHAQDCTDCVTREGKVDEITCEIMLEGDLDAEQRQQLLEVANRCPVHRSLTTETKIRVRPGIASK